NLYTHLFRSVYATIATFWYCPEAVNPDEFKAAIQGHYAILDESNPELRRSLIAGRHYADYEIADSVIAQNNGKRKGIKLGVSVEPIEPFKAPTQEKTPALPKKKGQTSVRIFKEDRDLLEQVLEHLHLPDGLTQPKRMEHLLLWAKDLLEKPVEPVKVESLEQEQVKTAQTIPEPETAQLKPVSAQPEPIPTPEPINQLIGKIDQLVSILLLQQQSPVAPIPQPSIKPAPVRPKPISPTPAKGDRLNGQPKRVDEAKATPAQPIQDSTLETKADDQDGHPTRQRRSKFETDDLLEHAVSAILTHNDQAKTHDEKWAITINAIKGLGVKSQRKIELFLDDHKEQIDAHHLNHQIDPQTHNLRHRRKYKISDVIIL
ncbi:MAG TPA: hypothetical protein VIJ25_04205, partial [Methylococcales bacterium]